MGIEKQETQNEKAYIYQIGSYAKKLQNVLHVEKLKNINKPLRFQKLNFLYTILPDPEKKDTVNVVIEQTDPANKEIILKTSVFSFINGRLLVKRDVYGNLKSSALLGFFEAFNIDLKRIDLVIKKEYEFFLIKKRLPGIFCTDWNKPFKKTLNYKNDRLTINNKNGKLELSYIKNGQLLKWSMNKDFLLFSGDLDKLLYVMNRFGGPLVDFDEQISSEIDKEKEEYRSLMNNLNPLFRGENSNSRVRTFIKEYKKSDSNKMLITGDGEKINFSYKHSGPEQRWILNADQKLEPGSADNRNFLLALRDFRRECEDLKVYLKQAEEEKKKTDEVVLSFIQNYPQVFMKQNKRFELTNKKGEKLKISSADSFKADGSKFFLTYEKSGGKASHFYFAGKSLQSKADTNPPFGYEKENTQPGTAKTTYYFNTDSARFYAILKEFEPEISKSLT